MKRPFATVILPLAVLAAAGHALAQAPAPPPAPAPSGSWQPYPAPPPAAPPPAAPPPVAPPAPPAPPPMAPPAAPPPVAPPPAAPPSYGQAPPAPAPAPYAPAPLPPSSERSLTLKNGAVVRGRVVEEVPGQWVTLEVPGGWQVTVSASQIAPPGAQLGPATGAPATPAQDAGGEDKGPKDEAFRPGFRFGARAGIAIPYGKPASDSSPLGESVGTLTPGMLELGGQITPNFYLGAYGAYARGSAGSSLESVCSEADCSVYGARLGLALEVRILTESPSPWIGYAIGWSAEEIDVETDAGEQQTAFGGIDIANLTGGVDFALSRSVVVGPYGGVGFSMYLYHVEAVDGVGVGEAIEDTALHGFIQLGVRAALVL